MTNKTFISEIEVSEDFNAKLPVIYHFEVTVGDEVYKYIGKASKGATRPMKHYMRHVNSFLQGKTRVRKNRKTGVKRVVNDWRENVHPIMAKSDNIKLKMINVELAEIDVVETAMIKDMVASTESRLIMNKQHA